MNRWQFSTRNLLLLTAVVSAVLALAVNLPAWFLAIVWVAVPVLIVAALLQSANFLTSDNRPRVAMVSWMLLAAFFAFFAAGILSLYFERAPASDEVLSFVLFGVMAMCCIICLARACRSFARILLAKKCDTGQP